MPRFSLRRFGASKIRYPPKNVLKDQLDMVPIEEDDRIYEEVLIALGIDNVLNQPVRATQIRFCVR